MATPIGTLGTIPTLTVGGRVFTDLSTLITVVGSIVQATGTNSTCRAPVATAGYQVTTGKTYTIWAASYVSHVVGVFQLLYTDNDTGTPGATAFTNPKYYNSDSANPIFITAASVSTVSREVFFAVPALKYVSLLTGTGSMVGSCWFYGYET